MEIRGIRVRNIRSFESANLTLGPGTSLLWGDVGAGKTSLLHAIEMALFGFSEVDPAHLIRHRASTAEVSLTIADDAHVYVFTRRFHRRMRRGRDLFETDEKGTGLSTDGAMTRYPATELRQRAIDLLGFPDNPNPRAHSDLWRWAVYVPQERMRQILESDDSDARLETVRKALGLERYRAAAENAKLVAHDLRRDSAQQLEQAEALRQSETDLLEGEEALRSAERARADSDRGEADGRRKVAEISARLDAAQARARRLEGDRRELHELEARTKELDLTMRTRAERLSVALAKEHSMVNEVGRLKEASKEVEALRVRTEFARRAVAELTETVGRGQANLRELDVAEARRRDAQARRVQDRESLDRALAERARASAALARSEAESPRDPPVEPTTRSIAEVDSAWTGAVSVSEARAGDLHRLERSLAETDDLIARGICPQCGQAVTASAFHVHRAEVAAALDDAREEYREAIRSREALSEERATRESYERGRLAWEAVDQRRRQARSEEVRILEEIHRREASLAATERELLETESTVGRLTPRMEELRGAQERLRTAASDQERLSSELTGADRSLRELGLRTETLESLRQEIVQLRVDTEVDHARAKEWSLRQQELSRSQEGAVAVELELTSCARELESARLTVESWVGRQHRAESESESARRRIAVARARVRERERLRDSAQEVQAVAGFLTGPFRDAMLELEHRLLARAKVEFDRSFGRYFAALIEDPSFVARSDPQFNPSVEIDGELTPAEALSGGERTALALAFRLALGDVVRSLDRLHLSTLILDEPTDGFSPEQVQRMGELLRELGVPQVILVSHEAALNGIADRVVRVRKIAGASELVDEGGPAAPADPLANLQE
ncbi:MAG: SMC family ATPase [Thermoplasmata archaeon]|nr:SMC family ATPase [Thermoplasmata archaeon]MCI4358859.1 SMC family ATPase [Thermoplasmata archaeon]